MGDPDRTAEGAGTRAKDDERALLAAARGGDGAAFVNLLRLHDRQVRHVAWQVLHDRDAMDDVLQEVALKAFRALPSYRGDAAIGTWLCRIAYTTAIDSVRARSPEDPDPFDDPALLIERDQSEAVAARDELAAAFASLTAEQRLTVLLVDREGHDYASVAAVLGVAPGTVASRLSRAHDVLRHALSLDGADP